MLHPQGFRRPVRPLRYDIGQGEGVGMFLYEELRVVEVRNAAELLMARGYEGAHAEELARVFQVSVGQLYRLYGDKRALVRWVRASAQHRSSLQLMFRWPCIDDDVADFERDFVALWRDFASFALGESALFGMSFLWLPPREDAPAPRGELLQDLMDLLEGAARKGLVRPLPTTVLFALVWGPLAELARMAHLSGQASPDDEVAALAAAVWDSVRA
jgi:AcrR family transcriptional regulator